MGERVNFLAQTVITGDPNLELDDVGAPRSVVMTLTCPEHGESRPLVPFFIPLTNVILVTPYTIAYLPELVRRGPNAYPGARYVARDTGDQIALHRNKQADSQLLLIRILSPGPRGQHVIHGLASLYLLACHKARALNAFT
jgi:DNA-directed RNA polymerase II subunit RPB1